MNFLKNLFKPKLAQSGIVFIVEDNPAYAKTLELFIKSAFHDIKEVKIFPVGETCVMELPKNPDVIIIDYFLDSKYDDAATGLEIIKEIRSQKPEMNIIVLSSQQDIDVVIESVKTYKCSYVKKDEHAFARVEEIIKEIYAPL
jgi:DNA-binding NarL/FixJ family response regulator